MAMDPVAATEAYLNTLSAAELTLARDYTTGNHWLIPVGVVVSALATWLIVKSRVLDASFEKVSANWQNLRVYAVAFIFLVVDFLITLPFFLYSEWWRETEFGRTSQPLADYLAQGGISLLLTALIGGLFFMGVYFLVRRAGELWWVWASGLVAAFVAISMLLSPMLIEPLFNDFEPIPKGDVRDAVFAMADEAGIPTERVFMYDGSRQSNNFTANVSGIGDSARIAISDVAMDNATLDEVKAVTGHEVGHYVLGHVWRMIGVTSLMAVVAFFLTARTYNWFARRFGCDVGLSDVRGVAVLTFLVSLYATLLQPALNGIVRIGEREADAYSLQTVNLPDALAGALIKTAEYRYPLAGTLEEVIFYTHPTVENRVRIAMEWKAAHSPAEME